MSLSTPTLRKLLRECLPRQTPLRADPQAPEALLEQLRERFEGWAGVQDAAALGYHRQHEGPSLQLEVASPGEADYYWHGIRLYFHLDTAGDLVMECAGQTVPVAALDAVTAFVRACQAALERQRAQRAKREKLRNLKAKAIIAQVRQLAREEGFDFATEVDSVKLELYIRLDGSDCAKIDIPFTKFQEILPNLRAGIRTIRALQTAGIRFHIGRYARWNKWIDHRTLDGD